MKMNKIVASVSAASLAVSALATGAFAAGPYSVDCTHDVVDYYEVTLTKEFSDNMGTWAANDTIAQYGVGKEVKVTLTTGLAHQKKIDLDGEFKFSQSITATPTASGATSGTINVDGSVSFKDSSLKNVSGLQSKDYKFTPAGINQFTDLGSKIAKKEDASSKASVTISFKLSSVADLKSMLGTAQFGSYFQDTGADTDGLFKNNDAKADLEENIGDGVVNTATVSGITMNVTFPSEATKLEFNGDGGSEKLKGVNVTEFKVAELNLVTKKAAFMLHDGALTQTAKVNMEQLFTIDALQDMGKGGTLDLEFAADVPAGKQYVVRVTLENDLLNQKVIQSYTVQGNKITGIEVPANFTYSAATNVYGVPRIIVETVEAGWTSANKCYLKTITLNVGAADVAEATTAPTANEGDEQSNKPAETEKPAAPSQTDDKNQPTGVALAIVPAIVAAAGVIISKKRK